MRAQLFPTHIELAGWSWSGHTVHQIPLDRIANVRWWGGKQDVNFELTLESGHIVAIYLQESAGTWNYTLRRLQKKGKQLDDSSMTERPSSNGVGVPTIP